jgi:hypothetical protein
MSRARRLTDDLPASVVHAMLGLVHAIRDELASQALRQLGHAQPGGAREGNGGRAEGTPSPARSEGARRGWEKRRQRRTPKAAKNQAPSRDSTARRRGRRRTLSP